MKRALLTFVCLLILVPSCFIWYFYHNVTRHAASQIDRGAIERIITSESPVLYADGHTPIGVFFEKIHSKYISYADIPKSFVKALIAAEDKNFFDHMGFDLMAMLRAFLANWDSGKVVQGGSTITQQTAKNIFRREKRSYKAKLIEIIQAFLLERRYTKEEILEMYANQFFVNGYGKGLRIAAQYFFGKDAKDLDLVEEAFIVGSVKGPNRYNPFIKKTEAEKKEAEQKAKVRKDYVLSNMLKLDFITEDQYLEAKKREVPFKEGRITYRLNVTLDYVRNQLQSDYFRSILEEQGIDNFATSGISIYTSVDKNIQDAALMSLRRRLPIMDVKLTGYDPSKTTHALKKIIRKGPTRSKDNLPFLAQITYVDSSKDNCRLTVAWDGGGGIIDFAGLKPIGDAWLKSKISKWAVFKKNHVPLFLKKFQVGDLVPVQLMKAPETTTDDIPEQKVMLSMMPDLDGGVVVLQNGMIRAMVGGFEDRFFNRAVDAKRQLGSIFKPIVYAAALQLKWNTLDTLQNRKEIFQFEDTLYLPRPDHKPKSPTVSMTWAGAKSENLATVWLLYHLTDRLTAGEFRQVADLVGLDRREGESYQAYKGRIRDQYGVTVIKKTLKKAAFEEAKTLVRTDMIFAGHEKVLADLNRLHYDLPEKAPEFEELKDRSILRYNYKRLCGLDRRMKSAFKQAAPILQRYARDRDPQTRIELSSLISHFYRSTVPGQRTRIIYTDHPQYLAKATLIPLTPEWLLNRDRPSPIKEIWLEDIMPSGALDLLGTHVWSIYRKLLAHKRYSMEVLSKVRDFRTLVNLSFVVYLSKKVGISTELDPVLSFPLGPNSISILEAALSYETLMTGKIDSISRGAGAAMIPIIKKIVDREGKVIWEYRPRSERVLSERVCTLVGEILRKVMEVGTGRKAREAVRVLDIPVPTFGKTGTANRFTNSSFVGMIPGPNLKSGRLDIENGYVIASYVGYDDNRPMKGKHVEIYGSSGALPLWIDTAKAITNAEDYKKGLQLADLVFSPLLRPTTYQRQLQYIPVSPLTGIPAGLSVQGSDSPARVLSEAEAEGNRWKLKRRFDPF